MTLEVIRNQIDRIDFEILQLVNKRLELVLKARKFKTDIEDKAREEELISRIKRYSEGMISPDFFEKMFLSFIEESKKLQSQPYKLIGFMGEHGSYGEVAARRWNSSYVSVTFDEFAEIFEAVEKGVLDYGIVPVENTLGGVVAEVNELMMKKNLYVIGEVNLPIHHTLLVTPGTNHRDIKIVYSHPQALSQCRNFLLRNKLELRSYYNTAAAARMLSKDNPKSVAVVASKLCADIYDLEIIKENIEDNPRNATRFLVISREKPNPENGEKTSIIFSTQNKPGALYTVMEKFASIGVNLTRIESMPTHKYPENYAFFMDFQASETNPEIQKILNYIEEDAATFKILGSYKEDPLIFD